MALRFNPPPNWPAPPEGFVPPAGWQPDPSWGPAPEGWELWVDDSASAASAPVAGSANDAAWAPTQAIPTGRSAPVASPTGQPASAPSGDYAAGNQYAGPQSGSAPVSSSAASASPYASSMSYAQSPTPYHNQGQAGGQPGQAPQQGGWQPIDVNGGSGTGGKKPVTKQWWFWVIIGVVALLILIGIIAALAGGGGDDESSDSQGSGVGSAAAADPTTGSDSSDSGSSSSDSSRSSSDEQGMSMDNPADPSTQTIKIKANEYASDPDATVEIQFGAVEWDDTDAIKKVYTDQDYEEGYKDPGSDNVYMRVPVTVTYHGKGQMNPYDITIDYVDKGNTVEASSDTYLLDDEFNDQDMPRDGGTVTGYFTYVIPKADQKSGVFAVSGLSNYDQEMYMAAK